MADNFASHAVGMDGPAQGGATISPHATNPLPNFTRAIYVGGSGDLACEMVSGEVVTFVGLIAGAVYPFRVQKVFATGTTATNLVGLY